MPHLLVNRPRIFGRKVKIVLPPMEAVQQFKWEIISSAFHQLGSLLLLVGSILSIPKIRNAVDKHGWVGGLTFVAASCFYMTVSAHDCYELFTYHNRQKDTDNGSLSIEGNILDIAAAVAYFCGSLSLITGSFCLISNHTLAGAFLKMIGSFLFLVGAVINSAQCFNAPTYRAKLYSNLTATSYGIGSAAYLAGCIPYLWSLDSPSDQDTIDTYLAGLFIAGSFLFVVGGSLNMLRSKCIFDHSYPNMELGPVVTEREESLSIRRSSTSSASDNDKSMSEEAPLLTI